MNDKIGNILFDANVLIDFQKSDFSVLAEIRKHLGNIYLLKEVRAEVPGLTKKDCRLVDLKVISPPKLDKRFVVEPHPRLSREDKLNLYTAINFKFELATNDRKLRAECEKYNVNVIWGLELLLKLVERSKYSIDHARYIGERIGARNRRYITTKILDEFIDKLEKIRINRP